MGSNTPSWAWQVKSSNKILKASILVIANNLNHFCPNHNRKFLQLSYLSWTEEGKKERAGGWGCCFFLSFACISQNSTSAHPFSTVYLLNVDSLVLINITPHLQNWFNDSGAKKLYAFVSNYRRTDLHTQFQNHTRELIQPTKNKNIRFLIQNL